MKKLAVYLVLTAAFVIFILGFAAIASAQDKTPGPTALSLQEQENVSRLMIALREYEVQLLQAREAVTQAQNKVAGANQAYQQQLKKLQEAHNAAGMALTVDKKWKKPTEPASAE